MIESAPLAVLYALLSALFLDWKTVGVMYALKTYRVLTLWIIVYGMEKVFSENYLRRAFINHEYPPPFTQFVAVCWALEFIVLLIPMFIVAMMYSRYKSSDNAFIIDYTILRGLLTDYTLSSLLLVLIGNVIVKQIQNKNLFRYDHEGLRGIRAGAEMFFQVSSAIIFVPFYSVAD